MCCGGLTTVFEEGAEKYLRVALGEKASSAAANAESINQKLNFGFYWTSEISNTKRFNKTQSILLQFFCP